MTPPTLTELLDQLDEDVKQVKQGQDAMREHGPSRYVGPGADPEYVKQVAEGQARAWRVVEPGTGGRAVAFKNFDQTKSGAKVRERTAASGAFAKAVLDVATHNVRHLERTPRDWAEGKALAEQTDSSGGYLLPVEVATDVAALIRANTAFLKMPGITHVQPKGKRYQLPGLQSGASASYLYENSSIPASAETFRVMAEGYPRAVAALVACSNWLLEDAATDPSIEAVIQEDMSAAVAVTQDQALLYADGTNGQPTGLTHVSGLTPGPNLGANGAGPTYANLQAIPAALRSVNAPFKAPGWIVSPKLIDNLLEQTDSLGRPLFAGSPELLSLDDVSGMTGKLLGMPFVATNSLPTTMTVGSNSNGTEILFSSDWQEAYYLEWEGIALASSSEAAYTPDGTTWISSFQSYQTLFRLIGRHDLLVRRPQFFVVSTGWLV